LNVIAWRIFKRKHAASAFSGEGARRYGGRWNSKGTPLIYTSQSASLAVLEMLVHLETEPLLQAYLVAPVTFADDLVETLPARRLPVNWRQTPPPIALQRLGDRWVAEQRSVVLRVPSVIIPTEHNYLLNPAHPDFAKCSLGKPQRFVFDARLRRRES
jgi:RES domain-containing protein